MSYTAIEFDRQAPVATITFNRPEKRNALDHSLLGDLVDALDVVADDDEIKVAILRANGPAFSAGFDLDGSPYISVPEGEESWNLRSGHKHQRKIRGIYEAIWDNPKVVIAQIHGHCLAGGMYITMLCDLAVAADDAIIGEPFMRMGGASSMPFWSYLVGPRRATDMLLLTAGSSQAPKPRTGDSSTARSPPMTSTEPCRTWPLRSPRRRSTGSW